MAATPGGRLPASVTLIVSGTRSQMLAGDHRRREIRRADARGEQIQRAARDRVAVGADDEVAGQRAAALGNDLMS